MFLFYVQIMWTYIGYYLTIDHNCSSGLLHIIVIFTCTGVRTRGTISGSWEFHNSNKTSLKARIKHHIEIYRLRELFTWKSLFASTENPSLVKKIRTEIICLHAKIRQNIIAGMLLEFLTNAACQIVDSLTRIIISLARCTRDKNCELLRRFFRR